MELLSLPIAQKLRSAGRGDPQDLIQRTGTLLITIKQLQDLEGSVWAEKISNEITTTNTLFWHAASELASMIELFLPVEQAREVAPEAIWTLEGAAEYFEDLGVPRPHTVAALLLRLDRLKAGLDPDGE